MEKSKIINYRVSGSYYIDRGNMQGNYCPDTGEYYLARYEGGNPVVLAYYWVDGFDCCHADSSRGYSYDVVRELLQLGHLTKKTLASFIAAGGKVWWAQP